MSILTPPLIGFIDPWLNRVTKQLEPEAKKQERSYDERTSREDLRRNEILRLIIDASRPPSNRQTGLINNYTVINNPAPVIVNPLTPQSTKKKEEKKKQEVNWKNIVVLTFVCTAITSVSVFIYTRLAKTEQRAKNYLDKTLWIKQFANTFMAQNDPAIMNLKTVTSVQEKIDQNRIDKIKGYKYATLAALVGTITMTAGAVAMPWFAVAGTMAVVAGMVLGSGSVVYATYNLASHWSDEQEAREQLTEISNELNQLNRLIRDSEEEDLYNTQPSYNPYMSENPPSYSQSERDYGYVASEATAPNYPTIPNDLRNG